MASRVRLDSAGIAAVLKSAAMQRAVKMRAEQVKRNVEAQGHTVGDFIGGSEIQLPVEIRESVTDRARATVALAHPAGQAIQAKHGALTKAAAQAGLEVTER